MNRGICGIAAPILLALAVGHVMGQDGAPYYGIHNRIFDSETLMEREPVFGR